jgi:hypothetical protein
LLAAADDDVDAILFAAIRCCHVIDDITKMRCYALLSAISAIAGLRLCYYDAAHMFAASHAACHAAMISITYSMLSKLR